MTRHVLVLGGARSGKTAFAESLALRSGSTPVYLATAEVLDGEMRDRVASHQAGRAGQFATIEEPLALSKTLIKAARTHDVILVDCLTLWITNLLIAGDNVASQVERLGQTLGELSDTRVILVSNEVGQGVVPMGALSRRFVDEAGRLHQELAAVSGRVVLVTAGLEQVLKAPH